MEIRLGTVVRVKVDKTFNDFNEPTVIIKKGTIGVVCEDEMINEGWVLVEFDMPELIEDGGIPLYDFKLEELEVIDQQFNNPI